MDNLISEPHFKLGVAKMKNNKDILLILDQESDMSQRDIAEETGLALGTVNTLLKKLVKKGLLKIERLNSRNLRYVLTPAGIKEKTKKTLSYVKKSYQAILKLQDRIRNIVNEIEDEKDIIILGEKNEVHQIVSSVLAEMEIDYIYIDSMEKIENNEAVILYWEPDVLQTNENIDEYELINVLVEY